MSKPLSIEKLFTPDEINRAKTIKQNAGQRSITDDLVASIMTNEKMEEITKLTGKESDKVFYARALEFALRILP